MTIGSKLFVIIPHAGTQIPDELQEDVFHKDIFKELDKETDMFTDKLYDFKNTLHNNHIIFKYHRGLIDVNEPSNTAEKFDTPVSNYDFKGHKIYITPLTKEQKQYLIDKYYNSFHARCKDAIAQLKPALILDAHSTHSQDDDVYGDRFEGDISLGNYQKTKWDKDGSTLTCSNELLEGYAENLQKLLPRLQIQLNSLYLTKTYGYIEENYTKLAITGIPLILQETNEKLYTNNWKLDELNCRELNKLFAQALAMTMRKLV